MKLKYDCALNEIKDLQTEQTGEKEDLMIQLRQQDLDIKFYTKVVDMVMKTEELAKLKMKSSYDDATNEWQIPIFLLKAREVALPSLSIKKNAQEFMEHQKNERQLTFEGDKDSGDQSSGSAASANRNNNYLAQYEAAQRKNFSFESDNTLK